MAVSPKDFMSTQTGGEGTTIQANIDVPTPEQFSANIAPQTQPEQQVPAPEQTIVQPTAPVVQPELMAQELVTAESKPAILSEEDKIYQDLNLSRIEVDVPESVLSEKITDLSVSSDPVDINAEKIPFNNELKTEFGNRVFSASDLYLGEVSSSSIMEDEPEEDELPSSPTIGVTETGINVYSPSLDQKIKQKQEAEKYLSQGIKVDQKGKVQVKETPADMYPTYKLPETGVMYQKRGDKWYKDTGGGNFVPLTKGDVKERSEYLNRNAVPVSDLGTGTKNVQKAAAGVQERFGNLRNTNIDNILTSGGDPTVTDGMSFRQLTRSNTGTSDEQYNQDGTLNFNYDPKTANLPREVANIVGYKGKADGQYMFPGSSSTYKKENGSWYIKPKGTKDFVPLTKGDVEERIHNLEMGAKPLPKVKDAAAAMSTKKNALGVSVLNMGISEEIASGEFFKTESYEQSFDDATNFASKDINMLLKDDMSMEQKNGLIQYQQQLKQIIGDGSYSPDKAVQASNVLKEAEQFFATSKSINKSINEAAQNGASLSRISYEKKKMTVEDMFLTGKDSSEFASEAFELFQASSEMADFFIENTENGKIRFDSESGQYVISNQISERERQYIDSKLGQYVQEYERLQNERFANVNDKISSYKRSLYATSANVKKIENSLQGMRNAGVKTDDPKYSNLYTQLMKEKKKAEYLEGAIEKAEVTKSATFLTEPKKVAKSAAGNMSEDAKNIFNAIPKDITPKQRFDLFYESLYDETKRFMRDNGINERGTLSGMNTAFKDLLDWDGFYALSDAEKKAAQNIATLRELAPLYYNNDTGITQESAGFFESFMNSFSQTLFPTISKAAGFENQTGIAQKYIETFAEQGYGEDDFVDQDIIEKLTNRTDVGFYTAEGAGGMLGTTAAIIAPIIVAGGVPATSLRAAKGLEAVLRADVASGKAAGIVKNAERIYDAVLSSNKVGRFLKPAVESGIKFEAVGNIFGSTEDELYFLSGFAGGVASEALSGLISKMPKEKVYGYLSSVFGNQTNRAVNVMKAIGEANARGVAETGEEFAQEVTNIYRDTDSFKGLMSELSNRFGTFDDVQEFVISSFVMGAAFGLVDRKQSDNLIDKLPEGKKEQVQGAISEIASSLNKADAAVAEYAGNKKTQEEVNTKIEEYDRKDESGVSGEVREGQKPIEEKPVAESGQEAPSPSGMVQGEQGQTTEPKEERVIATNADEAKALWDQGYRPSIEGAEVQGGKDAAIDNIFNTRQEVDMVRMVTPEVVTEEGKEKIGPKPKAIDDASISESNKWIENTKQKIGDLNDGDIITSDGIDYKVNKRSDGSYWLEEQTRGDKTYDSRDTNNQLLVMATGKGWEVKSKSEVQKETIPTEQPLAPTEEKQLTEKERFSQNLSLSELDALRTSIRNKFPDSYTIEVLDNVAESMRTGESSLPFELDYLSDGITLNDVQGILAQDEVFETSKDARNFLRERAISGELLKAKDESRAEGVKERAYEKLAEKIRSGKIDTKGSAMISIVPPQVLNAALEGVALTVETVGQVIQKIKDSDWYKSLNEYSKPIIEREITRSLNNLTSKTTYTEQDAINEAYATEFSDVYDRLLNQANQNPNAANVNNLKAFTDNPKQFVQDLVDTGEIKSDVYYGINIDASDKKQSTENYIAERMAKVDSSISSDAKTNANNIIAKQQESKANTDAPFMMSESVSITSDIEKAKANEYTDEEIKDAQEYLNDPIKYHQEMYDLFNDSNSTYYDEERAQKALRELNYVKSVYERYGVDTGLTPEQSQDIEDQASQIPPQPKTKATRKKLTDEEKQARADQRKAEREKIKAAREEKKKADKEFGKKVAEVTGTAKPEKTVQRTPIQALKDSIRDREMGWRMGQRNLQDIKGQIRDYAKENLPKDDYSKKEVTAIMNAITNAKTPKGLEKALERVENMVNKKAEARKKRTVRELSKKIADRRTLFTKQGNKWVGKVSIDAQKEFLDFINSGAVDNLENRTQQELDAINDVLDGIIENGKADYKAVQRAEQKAKRERAAKLIAGIAKKQKFQLKGIDKVREWLDKGNVVIINGQLFRKSDLKTLENQKQQLQRKKKAKEKELEALNNPSDVNRELQEIDAQLNSLSAEIDQVKNEIAEFEQAIKDANIDENSTFDGYKQGQSSVVKEALNADRTWYKPKNWFRAINPTNAINDVYSLLKSAYSGSSDVAKFIKNNLENGIKKAYFEKQRAYHQKMKEYNKSIADIFGSEKQAMKVLSSSPEVDPFTFSIQKESFPMTNGHMVDWYNLIRSNEDGAERIDKNHIDANKVIEYIESNPDLKRYADYLLNEYNTTLRSEYEPVYETYTNTPFGDTTYYPSYASNFDDQFVSESEVMGEDDMYNAMNATSRNLKQRTNYSGPFDIRMDAHAKFLDYIKTMEHAKHFMPIAKSANELFNKINSPYLLDIMGVNNFTDLKVHLGVILGDAPIKEFKGGLGKGFDWVRNFSIIATLGAKPASIVKQYTSFVHYWTAGISRGIDPHKVLTSFPKTKEELEFASFIIGSDYIKERYTGESIDIEIRKLAERAARDKTQKAFKELTQKAMWPVREGDRAAILYGPGGGTMFAVAVYKDARSKGMSVEEATDYAYEAFVTETEATQQTTRADYTSNVQRDPIFRLVAMYRTGQMSATKKIVNAIKLLNESSKITTSEGKEARKEVISERDKAQAVTDLIYYSTFGNLLFNAVASGSLYFYFNSDTDDDEKKRMWYDAFMDQIQSNLQGFGFPGFIGDWVMSAARDDKWKNNVPSIKFLQLASEQKGILLDAAMREWSHLTPEQRKEYLKSNEMKNYIVGGNMIQDVEEFLNTYADQPFWKKMTEKEADDFIKAVGLGNINKFIKNLSDKLDENENAKSSYEGMFEAVMGYDDDYFTKALEKGKDDKIYRLLFNEPYLPKKKDIGFKPNVPFPESLDSGVDENFSLEERLD
jgi:hypothetical protein